MKRSFWSACESIPGLTAVESEWRLKSGIDFELARVFLKPRQTPATSIPCPTGSCNCFHEVVHRADDRISAVCRCEPPMCDTVYLTAQELIVYELDRWKLYTKIGELLFLDMNAETLQDLRKTTQLGFDTPMAGSLFPVFLTIQYRQEDFHDVVSTIAARQPGPFIFITPTAQFFTPSCRSILDDHKALFLTLPDIMALSDGKPTGNPTVTDALIRFHSSVVPAAGPGDGVRRFKTPSGAQWSDLEIRFIYGDKVSVKVISETGVFNCAEMGMASKKNGEPTEQWKLLREFANGHGSFDWGSPKADRVVQKQRENLAKDLRAFFRIAGDPFFYVKETKGWQARFRIEPE